ncbi:MAG: hypothetical protein RL742_193 [Bacteroidota bacterium]|jgi:cell fate regulator YaaT (PSP1 superfamily)
MGCLGCSCSTGKDSAGGCRSNGGCSSGGCNRHNTYDWITALGITDARPFEVVEVSFKNGSRKEFFKNPSNTRTTTGDYVLVESSGGGYDLGQVSLSGELVRLQMKRKRVRNDAKLQTVIRKAHERDLERLDEVRQMERDVMIRARAISRTLDLNMKIGDVEFQGDGRKCTFYYTADGRVDFRELIRHYAREFKVKIEMRQIGARQESARIGGLGNCGRELCCSTWLTEFKSVNTSAARYQNLAINQTKLSGMCGRLKCCLNYELDTYIEALEEFPDRAERIKTRTGLAILVKTDVFKRLMFYTYADDRSKFVPLHVDQVWEVLEMIKNDQIPNSLDDILAMAPQVEEVEEEEPDFESVDNVIELPIEKRKKKKKKKKKGRSGNSVAAAVEKQDRNESGKGAERPQNRPPQGSDRRGDRPQQPGGKRPDDRRPRKPDDRPQQPGGKRPDARPDRPQQPGGKHPDDRNARKPDDRPANRPPDQRPPQKGSDTPPGGQNDRPNTGTPRNDNRNNNNNRNKQKNRPPDKPPKDS